MDLDGVGIDEEAADPPVKWVSLAAGGLLVAAVGLVAAVLGLVGMRTAVVGAIPALAVVFEASVPLLLVGVGAFVVSMTEWDPDVET